MRNDKASLRRAILIERVRSAEHRLAAGDAFQAEAVRHKLEQLSERTDTLAKLYAMRDQSADAADLRAASIVGTHVRELGRTAARQAERARKEADCRLADLDAAERRRQLAEDTRRELRKAVLEQLQKTDAVPMRKTGTHLE